ncbi:hypothetical protein [Achromobacter spanius]|uniref:Uncharacterized protein n=1 Tax=Achromobacter spanius TaxID=217203 RepID=A0AAW3I1G6_9BURK|nr:hypothetical protein [Achromobacter spanius]KNE26599.1 hypothetical protein AFM18_16210 [Achromobacter spanius]
MFWLTLVIAVVVAVGIAAVLLRHPGVVFYDWIATHRTARHARERAATALPRVPTPAGKHVKRVDPAPLMSN